MKGYSHSALIAVLLMTSFLFSSCIKEREYIEQHPSDIGKYCRIDSMSVNNVYAGMQYFKFSYDAKDRPIEMRLQNPARKG